MPRKEPSEPCESRIGFATSDNQYYRIREAADRMKVSVAEWLRRAAKNQLTRQKL